MPSTRFFPDARLNVAENLLHGWDGDDPAIIAHDETRPPSRAVRPGAARAGRRLAAALRGRGVGAGDRVAAWLPNVPEAVIVMLAAASLGAVVLVLLTRLRRRPACSTASARSSPRVLVAADGYHYGGKRLRTASTGCARSAPDCRRSPRPWSCRCSPSDARLGAVAGAHGVAAWPRAARRHAADVRALPVRPPVVRPLLVGHDRASPSASCTAPAASCSCTSRSTSCTATCTAATGCSTTRPPAG